MPGGTISSEKIDLLIYGPSKPIVDNGFSDQYVLHSYETIPDLERLPPAGRASLAGPYQLRAVVATTMLVGGVLVAGCSSAPATAAPGPATTASAPATTAPAPKSAASSASSPTRSLGQLSKILVIMEENHSIQQVFPSGMPYLWSLGQRYAYATDWSDVAHPSLPNYLAIFGGSAFDKPQDCAPAPGCTYPGPTVFGQALARGESAKAYEESMPSNCDKSNSGEYAVRHNPAVYYTSLSGCGSKDVPYTRLSSLNLKRRQGRPAVQRCVIAFIRV